MPFAWRIVKRKHAGAALDGEGARLHGGRWNPRGLALVYLADSRALALLEVLVHLGDAALAASYVSIRIEFAQKLCEELPRASLPEDWWHSPSPPELQAIGEKWAHSARSLLLAVPSAIVPSERVLLLNPSHVDVRRSKVDPPEDFHVDPRLVSPRG